MIRKKEKKTLLHNCYAIKVSLLTYDTDQNSDRTDDIANTFVPATPFYLISTIKQI